MIIGLCGCGFPEVRRALARALPEAEITTIRVAAWPAPSPGTAVDVLVPLGETVGAAAMDATRPKLIQQFGVGLQGVDLAAARARGIPVAYVPAANTGNAIAVAEIAILHALALLQRYPQAHSSVREGRLGQPCGSTLAGKVTTVVGVGAIGTALIARLTAFEARPIGVGPRDRAAYPTAAALRTGHLAGAGIDVAWQEPIDPGDALLSENVTVTPHIGGVTTESYSAMAQTFAANVHNLRTSRPIAHRAD